jgi:hypothetical protein
MITIALVTPAWKRYHISEIIFFNFDKIKKEFNNKFNLIPIIISDDDNVNIAKNYNFITKKTSNQFLGKKFNDGYQLAVELKADVIIPVGSDSLITGDIILSGINMFQDNQICFSTKHSMINEEITKIGCVNTAKKNKDINKGALWMYSKDMIVNCKNRPCKDDINKLCDRSTIDSILKYNKDINFKLNNINYFQHLAIKNSSTQIWHYKDYKKQFIKEYNDIQFIIKKEYGDEIWNMINKIKEK